ncbi:unnamed protein product [Phytophthora lilii]|uniref:Unnamed protein product n=1 Tax=Phytophthora lilii TaxID=2077276 RepID=A0A9W6TZS8_9STRA|nr:unnamed protein product [Phytophthora lilii]
MSNLEDEESSADFAEDSFKSEQDRNDVDGLVSGVERKIEAAKIQSQWSSVGLSGDGEDDDMNEVEGLMLEKSLAHSSKQVKPHIDNECDQSDEFATSFVHNDFEEKPPAVVDEVGEASVDDTESDGRAHANAGFSLSPDQFEQSDAEQDPSSEEEQDPLEESSFDNAMMSALEGREVQTSIDLGNTVQHPDAVEADHSDTEGCELRDAIAESSFDDSMRSESDEELNNTCFADNSKTYPSGVDSMHGSSTQRQPSHLENFDNDNLSDSEATGDTDERTREHHSIKLEDSAESVENARLEDQHDEVYVLTPNSVAPAQPNKTDSLEESSSSIENGTLTTQLEKDAVLNKSSPNAERSAQSDQFDEDSKVENSEAITRSGVVVDETSEIDTLEESASNVDIGDQLSESDELDKSTSSSASGAVVHGAEDNKLEGSSSSSAHGVAGDQLDSCNVPKDTPQTEKSSVLADERYKLEESASSFESCGLERQEKGDELDTSASGVNNIAYVDEHDEVRSLDESSTIVESVELKNQFNEQNANRNVSHRALSGSLTGQYGEHDEVEISVSNLRSGEKEDFDETPTDVGTFRHTYGSNSLPLEDNDAIYDRNDHGLEATTQSDSLAESSSYADNLSDGDDEVSASMDAELSPQPVKHSNKSDNDDEWSEEQLREAERSLGGALALEEEEGGDGKVEAAPAMSLRMEDEDSSEEEETMAVQSQPAFSASLSRFGMGTRRLNLEEDDDMDEVERLLLEQSSSSMRKRQQQTNRFASVADDDDEFGEVSLQSNTGNDGELGEDSIRSRDGEFGKESIESHDSNNRSMDLNSRDEGAFNEATFTHQLANLEKDVDDKAPMRSHQSDFDELSASSRSHEAIDIGIASIQSILQVNNEFGYSSTTRDEDEFGEASRSRSREKDEFGEASFCSGSFEDDNDEFGEISIPLHKDTCVGAQASSRSLTTSDVDHSTRLSGATSRAMTYHEGLMDSPVKVNTNVNTTTITHGDSDAENDYMDESFDLDESLEEVGDDNEERHV